MTIRPVPVTSRYVVVTHAAEVSHALGSPGGGVDGPSPNLVCQWLGSRESLHAPDSSSTSTTRLSIQSAGASLAWAAWCSMWAMASLNNGS